MKFSDVDIPEGFDLIPSMAVMSSTPVWVNNDKYTPIEIEGTRASVAGLAKKLTDEFGRLHYIDILGIRRGVVEWNLFQDVVDQSGDIWADMGIVYSEGLIDVIMAGAQNVVITTKMIDSLEEIVSSFELTENLVLQIDHDGAVISKDKEIRKMSAGELVREMASFGMEAFILDDIKEGRNRVNEELLLDILKNLPDNGCLYLGVEDLSEIKELHEIGVTGSIISCSKLIEGVG